MVEIMKYGDLISRKLITDKHHGMRSYYSCYNRTAVAMTTQVIDQGQNAKQEYI